MLAAFLLAVSVVENAVVSSPQLGTFFAIPGWMTASVTSSRTFGSCDATNFTHRVDPTALAAANACFEAYSERTYFAHAGQSNIWNEAVYGPRCTGSDKHEFRFALPTNAPSPFAYAPDTNRVVATRRLVEYGNLNSLANALMSFRFIGIERPNWWKEANGWYDHGIRWSSTLFDGLETNYGTLAEPLPLISWCGPSSFLSSRSSTKWSDCAPYFRQATNGNVLEWCEPYGGDINLAWEALDEVSYGEPPTSYVPRHDYMDEVITFTNTVDSIIGEGTQRTNGIRREVGVEGLTNATRRLFTDRLAGIGLTLGAIDRTYAKIDAPMPNVVTQHFAGAANSYSATVDVWDFGDLYYDEYEGKWTTGSLYDITVPPLEFVDSHKTNAAASAVVDGRYVRYATDMVHNLTYSRYFREPPDCGAITMGEELVDMFDKAASGYSGESDFYLEFVSMTQDENGLPLVSFVMHRYSGTVTNSTPGEFTINESPEIHASDIAVEVLAESQVSYQYGFTYGSPRWTHGHKSYPGDFSRVSQQKLPTLWTMAGAAYLRGDANHPITFDVLEELVYSSSFGQRFSSEYATMRHSYSSASVLFTEYNTMYHDVVTRCVNRFNSALGVNPDNPAAVLAAVSSGMTGRETLSNLYLEDFQLQATLKSYVGPDETVLGIGGRYIERYGQLVAWPLTARLADGTTIEFNDFTFMGTWDLSPVGEVRASEGHEPENTDIYGIVINAKTSPWAKVDWDWHALKRTRKPND